MKANFRNEILETYQRAKKKTSKIESDVKTAARYAKNNQKYQKYSKK